MQFLTDIKKSVYSPEYYRELLSKPFSYSLKYYFLLTLVISLVTAVVFSFFTTPHVKLFLDGAGDKVLSYYPSELVVTIKNGQASTNVAEPYVIKMPQELKNNKELRVNGSTTADFENLLVIDTKSDLSIEKFKAYHTASLLTQDSVVSYGKNGAISIQSLEKSSDFSLDKSKVEFFINKVRPYFGAVYPFMFVGVFLGIMMVLWFKLVYLFFGTLLVWLIARLNKVMIGYGKSYQLGIHLMTLGILVGWFIGAFNFYIGPVFIFSFFFTAVLVIMAVINIKQVKPLPVI